MTAGGAPERAASGGGAWGCGGDGGEAGFDAGVAAGEDGVFGVCAVCTALGFDAGTVTGVTGATEVPVASADGAAGGEGTRRGGSGIAATRTTLRPEPGAKARPR